MGLTDDQRLSDANDPEIDHDTSASTILDGANLACGLSENSD